MTEDLRALCRIQVIDPDENQVVGSNATITFRVFTWQFLAHVQPAQQDLPDDRPLLY